MSVPALCKSSELVSLHLMIILKLTYVFNTLKAFKSYLFKGLISSFLCFGLYALYVLPPTGRLIKCKSAKACNS